MAYFPIFYNLDNKKVLVVGGGAIAREKLEKLLDFTTEITVIATAVDSKCQSLISKHSLKLYKRPYEVGDIDGFDIVIVATDTVVLHQSIFLESRNKNILVNSVDNTKYCDFIFPSYIKEGDLTIAFSTSGASPAFAKHIKRYFKKLLPTDSAEFLKKLKSMRKTLPKGKKRMQYFDKLVEEFFIKNKKL